MARVNEGEVHGTIDELLSRLEFVNPAALQNPGWGEAPVGQLLDLAGCR